MSIWSYQAMPELSDEQYLRWQKLLESRTGICFLQHKSILQTGLVQRMREIGVSDYDEYFDMVEAVPKGVEEWKLLVDRIAVKETSFFREPHSYDALKNFLLDYLDGKLRTQDYTLDIWSVGCSTGEEPYSLAMAATDMIDYLAAKVFLGVIATDISASALEVARKGIYSARKVEALPLAVRHKFFNELAPDKFQIIDPLRQRICFVQGNIIEQTRSPKLKMDVIFCQNLLVYFRREKQQAVLDTLVGHLKVGGLLMVAPGEVTGWKHPKMQRTGEETVQAYIKVCA